ncbi:MAG: iron-sulfur cluster biosynthesis family protein [Carnobacterium sp.]|uniref:iron-sulfur cluster biosynthesis family protein n=1 Tax=Carnobacterium sp. TaxID=48221 RepID=UPI003C73446F
MFLTITKHAQERIALAKTLASGQLVIYYESRIGCVCGNNGIFSLRITNKVSPEMDSFLKTTIGDLNIQGWSLDFLDNELKLDFDQEKHALVLRGNSGLINANVLITNDFGVSVFTTP